MAATAVLDERNGSSPGTRTDAVINMNFGDNDSFQIVPATYPVLAGENSFEKWWKYEFTGAFTTVDNLKVWKESGAYVTGEEIYSNAREASYGGEETYATPVKTTSTYADVALPATEPSGANLGIGGSLAGQLVAPGDSDHYVAQARTTGATPAGAVNTKNMRIQWDET